MERMASSLGRLLVCFYCNRKSTRRQDGTISQWECASCEAVNYLDENGEITDPPVATFEEAPLSKSFAKAIPPPVWSTASTADSVFCQTCLKNQHLYRSSLAQYLPEDPDHPDYARLSQNIQRFEAQLEERYPQVCENCVEKVQDRMKRAVYSAKVDAHGKQLERTRLNGGPGKKAKRTWLERIQYWGKIAWVSGIYLQLACEVIAIIKGFRSMEVNSYEEDSILADEEVSSYLYNLLDAFLSAGSYIPRRMTSGLPNMAASGLLLSSGTLWWNPEFRYTIKNGLHEVHGLESWYAHQAILLLLRGLFWYLDGKFFLSDAKSSINLATHLFVLAFTVWVSATSPRKVTVRSKPLFSSTPDREALIAKRKTTGSPSHPPNSLYEALNSISQDHAGAPSPVARREMLTENFGRHKLLDSPGTPSSISYTDHGTPSKPNRMLRLVDSPSSFTTVNGRAMGKHSPTLGRSTSMEIGAASDPDEMEWMPSQSVHRAFNSGLSTQRDTQHFNQAPSGAEASPFWFKVPPAPITPARKLRNPPNQPLLSAPSEEVKQNFFNKMTSNVHLGPSSHVTQEPGRHDTIFAQPKFFPPDALDDTTGLADAFNRGFSFDEREAAAKELAARERPQSQNSLTLPGVSINLTCVALGILLWFWNLSFHRATEYSRSMTQASMTGCILIGLRSFLDCALSAIAKSSCKKSLTGAILAALETAAATYILIELNTVHLEAAGSLRTCGSSLYGIMILRQLLGRYGLAR